MSPMSLYAIYYLIWKVTGIRFLQRYFQNHIGSRITIIIVSVSFFWRTEIHSMAIYARPFEAAMGTDIA